MKRIFTILMLSSSPLFCNPHLITLNFNTLKLFAKIVLLRNGRAAVPESVVIPIDSPNTIMQEFTADEDLYEVTIYDLRLPVVSIGHPKATIGYSVEKIGGLIEYNIVKVNNVDCKLGETIHQRIKSFPPKNNEEVIDVKITISQQCKSRTNSPFEEMKNLSDTLK